MSHKITASIKKEVLEITGNFNKENKTNFQISFRGQFAYLSKIKKREISIPNSFSELIGQMLGISTPKINQDDVSYIETKLGRLKYEGQMDNWSFAVYRYSREYYDPDEWMFPGSEELNGTILGALNAGLYIYD
ncbi:hypothetical protein [Lewinella sp. LCG006]|uniref:hypothetical protein n=1 Tax=Lewinella sp. LCG006 TaxID=3231911 RepID=UPI0034601213